MKNFFFAWNEKLWYPDAQTPTHNRQSKSTTTLRSSEGEKKHEKNQSILTKNVKILPLISLDIAWIGWWKFLRLSTECDKKCVG